MNLRTNMRKRISKADFLAIKKELISIAHDCGYTVRMTKHPIKQYMYEHGMRYFSIHGTASSFKKRLTVSMNGRPAHHLQLFILAHEVRHALHTKNGLYKDYYRPELETYTQPKIESYKLPCRLIAIRAERDCDRWAYNYLKEKGVDLPLPKKYPYNATLAAYIHQYFIMENNKEYK